jgi:molybdopterin-guanine dinucleotide biosynthesis protein A
MGRDKSRLGFGGRTMLGQIRATAKSLGLPVRVIRRDAVARCGPLGGVYTALNNTRAAVVMFLACDMPFVTRALLRAVLKRASRQDRALFVCSAGKPGFPFVLRREVLTMVAAQIEQGPFSLHELARTLRARTFPLPTSQLSQLQNVNTPRDWARTIRLWNKERAREA